MSINFIKGLAEVRVRFLVFVCCEILKSTPSKIIYAVVNPFEKVNVGKSLEIVMSPKL